MPITNIIPIDYVHDQRLAPYRDLRSGAAVADGSFVVEGRWLLERLIDSSYPIESILAEAGNEADYAERISPAPVYALPREAIKQLVGFDFHRGVLGCARRRAYSELEDLEIPSAKSRLALAMIDVQDQENAGSLLRSAAALGVNQILLGPKTVDPFRRRVIRVSMGGVLFHRFYRMREPEVELPDLRGRGFRTLASTLQQATDLGDFQPDDRPLILMVGNEADGLNRRIQKLATDRIRIPMHEESDSLNVAVAAAIMIYALQGASVANR